MGAEISAAKIFGQGRNRLSLEPPAFRGRLMPLSPEELNILRALSQPIDERRRTEFMVEAAKRLEAAPIGGPGQAHQIGRIVQRAFRDPPPDLCRGRSVPRA
jgi:hypothetical protein